MSNGTCPECGGTGFVTLLTSKIRCKHSSHGTEMSKWVSTGKTLAPDVRGITSERLNELQNMPLRGFSMSVGERISGPGYYAVCCEERMAEDTGPFGRPASRTVVLGELLCDAMPEFSFDLSKYLPLTGEGLILNYSMLCGDKIRVSFQSVGPVSKLYAPTTNAAS